jgi:hypothetical protein
MSFLFEILSNSLQDNNKEERREELVKGGDALELRIFVIGKVRKAKRMGLTKCITLD